MRSVPKKFEKDFNLSDNLRINRTKHVENADNVDATRQNIRDNPNLSFKKRFNYIERV